MNKLFVILFASLCFLNNYKMNAQTTKGINKTFIPLKMYKKAYNKTISQIDTLDILYKNGDTLVWDKNYKRPKGTSVKYEYKDENFLNIYKKIAFMSKNDSLNSTENMRYWKSNIEIFFSESISKKNRKKLLEFAKNAISDVDSIKVGTVKNIKDSNFVIYLSGDYDYESRMVNNKNTDFFMYWNNHSQIYRNSLKIFTDTYFNDQLVLNAMKDYFIRSLGRFQFDKTLSCDNYFSGCSPDDVVLTALDKSLITYHYSYSICKGTDKETFEKNHENAKKSLKKNNILINFFHAN